MYFTKFISRPLPAHLFFLASWFLGNTFLGMAQPAEIEWLPVIKTAKDQHTLAPAERRPRRLSVAALAGPAYRRRGQYHPGHALAYRPDPRR